MVHINSFLSFWKPMDYFFFKKKNQYWYVCLVKNTSYPYGYKSRSKQTVLLQSRPCEEKMMYHLLVDTLKTLLSTKFRNYLKYNLFTAKANWISQSVIWGLGKKGGANICILKNRFTFIFFSLYFKTGWWLLLSWQVFCSWFNTSLLYPSILKQEK